MSKLTLKDVKIRGEGPQIRKAIEQRYNSIEEFYEQHKVTKLYTSFENYLYKDVIVSDTFKCKVTMILDVDYPSLFISKEKQIKDLVKNIYDSINLYEEAEDQDTFDYLLAKCKKENMMREAAMMHRAKARVYYDTNWMNRCEEAYNYAIETLPKEDINYKVFFHSEFAYDMVKECMFDEAEKKFGHIEKIIRIHRKKLTNTTMHNYYYWRGIMHRLTNDTDLAISFFNKALDCADKRIEKLNVLSNIGLTYKNLLMYRKAHDYYEKAVSYHDEARMLATACVYNNIANLYRTTKDYENAVMNIEKALEMSKAESSLSKQLTFISTYAEIMMEIGDKEAYKEFFKLLLSTKGKKIYNKPYVLKYINSFIGIINSIPCLYELANIIIELKNASTSCGYNRGLVECSGNILIKVIELSKEV